MQSKLNFIRIFSFNIAKLGLFTRIYAGLADLNMFGGCFSLFMNVSKPRPNDHPLLVLFIVGGVTCSEVHQIREALAAYHPNTQVSFSKSCFLAFVVAWSRSIMDIMGFGFRWQAVEGKGEIGRTRLRWV